MLRAFLLLIAFIAVPDVSCLTNSQDNKISGGYEADHSFLGYQAYVVSVINDATRECGGAIITEEYIVTAAQCVNGATSTKVRVGIFNTSATEEDSPFINGTPEIHPYYKPSLSVDFDVAIIKTETKIKLGRNIRAVELVPSYAYENVPYDTNIVVSGWGVTTDDGTTNSEILMTLSLSSVNLNQCRNNTNLRVTIASFCAKTPIGNVCKGDSGGPAILYSSFKLIGLVTSISEEGCGKNPAVFANLGHQFIRDWIEELTGV